MIGLVLDSKLGLVVTDRNAVPTSIGDVLLTFANSIIIPAQVLYLHQVYNFAIVQYDPKLLGDSVVKDAVISDVPVRQNDSGI
jgi:pro-apoptotic serine protease NMA111